MKLLILDSKSFNYKLHHKTIVGEDLNNDQTENDFKNPLVVFIAVEKKDNSNTLDKIAIEISKIAIKNKSNLILINPFAHLSSNLAKPKEAIGLLDILDEKMREYSEFKTQRLIFGWYKEFSINVKGDENSQIYREF